jgi:DNA repair exonuclease SbcCD ATPase subunit
MIKIDAVRCKNFLSYGNAMTEFNLSSHKATLIRGKNGHGKSVILDLLMYGLYGKPYRSINKPQLVNSINRGDMLVEIDFRIGADAYQVRRGIKPGIFDIIKNDKLIEQDAAIKDYQEFLETQILKIPERTFKQIAVLGSASYVPFMKLQAWQRRELVESILDIEVFSKMNVILKERINSTREEFSKITLKIDAKKNEAVAQQKLITVIQSNKDQRIDDQNVRKKAINEEIAHEQFVFDQAELDISTLVLPEFDAKFYKKTSDNIDLTAHEIKVLKKKQLKAVDQCPTCLQKVTEDHVHHINEAFQQEILELEEKKGSLQQQLVALEEPRRAHIKWMEDLQTLIEKRDRARDAIVRHRNSLHKLDKSIIEILSDNSNIEEEKEKLKTIAAQALAWIERKNVLSEEKHIQDVCQQLLKDTGVKTAVVREYLPILNKLINKYLAMFDFFVDFTLDESFEEVIKSRGRDVFSYSSFSEGEKRRIDFAILMAFRQLAALKNSAKTNILILDEIVDGAFDLEARAAFNDLLVNIPNSNIIVISHADASTEQYDRVIQVEKQGDFSSYSIVE